MNSRQNCGIAPLAPVGLTAVVTGRTVALSWQHSSDGPPLDPLSIVVGRAPGLADLAVIPVSLSTTTVTAPAPPGTYYVRVVADNQCGTSASSNEVQVVVPY